MIRDGKCCIQRSNIHMYILKAANLSKNIIQKFKKNCKDTILENKKKKTKRRN